MTPSSADMVIIGGGIVGAAIACHLAARRAGRIRVLDAGDHPGSGSTGRATGGFRAQYGTAINVRLSLLALEQLTRFADEHGADPEYRPVGYLFMARTPERLHELRLAQAVQHAAGYPDAWRWARPTSAASPRTSTPRSSWAACTPPATGSSAPPPSCTRCSPPPAARRGAVVRHALPRDRTRPAAGSPP